MNECGGQKKALDQTPGVRNVILVTEFVSSKCSKLSLQPECNIFLPTDDFDDGYF